jgi:type II secretory pathway component PulM
MTFSERYQDLSDKTMEKLRDQEWFQQLQASYDQLPPEQQKYVKWGSLGGAVIVFLYFAVGTLTSANSLKSEYFEKQDLLQVVNQSGDEMRRLKGQNSSFTANAAPQTWKAVLESIATNQGLTPDAIEVTKETPGPAQSVIQETFLEVQVKNVPVRALEQMIYQIEHNTPPMKLKGMSTDTGADGNLTATLTISGFMPKPEKK